MKEIINYLKKSDKRKIQLTIANNLISSLDNDEECVMHSESNNMEIMINDEVDFDSLKNRCQNNLEPMKGSTFCFDYVQLLYFKCYEINLNCGGSYI